MIGGDLSSVRLHTGAGAARLARNNGALAVAEGQHVAFGAGQYQPGTVWGEAVLAHELAHARQQQDATSESGASAGLENEADQAGLIAALRLLDPERAARLAPPAISPSGLHLQRCAPPDFSEIEALPTREEYERRGELLPRAFATAGAAMTPGFAPVGGLIDLRGGKPSGGTGAGTAEEPALGVHPRPIPDAFGAAMAPMESPEIVLRLSAMEAITEQIRKLDEGERDWGPFAETARWRLWSVSVQNQTPGRWPSFELVGFKVDPLDVVPTDPAALAREVVRSERALDRIYDCLVELRADRQEESATGTRMSEMAKGRPYTRYDVDQSLLDIEFVRRDYLEALGSILTPKMIPRFNSAEQEYAELRPKLVHRKLEYYQLLTPKVRGIEGEASQINEWAMRLEGDLKSLQEEAPLLRAARQAKTPDFREREARFVEKADLLATSIEALGEWDLAVQALEILLGGSALWGFEGAGRIASRLQQMKDAAFDGDTEYLKLLLRDHRADPHVVEYYNSLQSTVMWSQLIIMLGIMLIAGLATAGVGLAITAVAPLALGALGVAEGSWVALSATFVAKVGGEALVFTIVSRALQSGFPGMAPTNKFWANPNVPNVEFSIDKGRQVLAAAGYTWDGNGRLQYPRK